ncbi:hypothetical protein WA026_015449 [Henosepilachna vigintioctopunctata]|uniref:Uncharacterized protein n=1 Tax=Henosepilachna vigintioctopunctata TaxID=420089 RepID=A0AAW1UJC9_9CUCU
MESIRQLVVNFKGSCSHSVFERFQSRLTHISDRILRLPIENLEIDVIEFKHESHASCKILEADSNEKFGEQVIVLSNTETSKNNASLPDFNALFHSTNVKSIPVHKCGETFESDRTKLFSFSDNIEDLRNARH